MKLGSLLLLGLLLGACVGFVYGQWQFEQAWQQAQRNPRSIQGDIGSYLCLMGDAPIYAGIEGAVLGAVFGLSSSLGWQRFRKRSLTN